MDFQTSCTTFGKQILATAIALCDVEYGYIPIVDLILVKFELGGPVRRAPRH